MILTGRKYHTGMIPAGLIIPSSDVVAPPGWTLFASANGKHIVGAGSLYNIAAMGGNTDWSQGSSTNGAHEGTLVTEWLTSGSDFSGYWPSADLGSAGNHSHILSGNFTHEYQQLVLIKADNDYSHLPANGIILTELPSAPGPDLTQCYNANRILKAGASVANGGGSLTDVACNSGGAHVHATRTYELFALSGPGAYEYKASTGNHAHTIAASALEDWELKRIYLTAWTRASAFTLNGKMIAMWESLTPPNGWRICNGSNGTPDLRDYFVMLSSSGNAGNQNNEANRIQISGSFNSNAWTHSHRGDYFTTGYDGFFGRRHASESHSHNHTLTTAWHTLLPLYYALVFIQKI